MKRKILITGANSLLGNYLLENLHKKFDIWATFHQKAFSKNSLINKTQCTALDTTDPQAVQSIISTIKPDVFIHLASLSNIDECEKNKTEAKKIHIQGLRNVIKILKNTNTHLIFPSSSMVFAGTDAPYNEEYTPNPINYYGKLKLHAERLIQASYQNATIIRFATLFGWNPKNSRDNDLTYYLKQLAKKRPMHLVNDRFFNPLYAKRAAEAIEKIINKNVYGLFHYGGADQVSRFSFVQKIAESFEVKSKAQLIPVSSDFFQKLSPRPKNTTLDSTKLLKELGLQEKSLKNELSTLKKQAKRQKIIF